MRGPVAAAAVSAALFLGGAPPAPAGEASVLRDAVIASDAAWDGGVEIHGRVIVRRGATLTILPGTVVRFVWSDADGDGIGDGELLVEGRLLARGEPARPIVFTSARERPAPKDWTYVMIERSRGSRVEHCLFEYAFTGLQVHFSTAEVRNSVFRRNFEGMRFSTADVLIERNDFLGNACAIRYESRGSETAVRRNRIRGNEVGFFPVVRSSSTVRIAENNVESGTYNVKMGQEQREDLDFTGNWWGSAEAGAIEGTFFDGGRDPALGRVLYKPFLPKPVEPCGREGPPVEESQ